MHNIRETLKKILDPSHITEEDSSWIVSKWNLEGPEFEEQEVFTSLRAALDYMEQNSGSLGASKSFPEGAGLMLQAVSVELDY